MNKRVQAIVLKAIKSARKRFPTRPRVVDVRPKFQEDWAGDDAVHVWVVLDDRDELGDEPGAKGWGAIFKIKSLIRDSIRDALEDEGLERTAVMVYPRFCLKSDQDAFDKELAS